MKNAKHIVKTVLFCGTLAVFSADSVFSPKEKGSFYENRRLAVFPVPSVETVLDGTFFSNVETYISDHFAYRVPLLRLNVRKELALHNPVVSNTVIAGDTLLPYHGRPRTDYDHENMQTVLDALSQVSAACETVGAKFVYLSIPEQSSALRYKYPSYLTSGTYTDDSMRTDFLAGLDARGIDCLNMAEYLCTDPEKYYSKTDHHYNLYGAYETYLRTMEHLQTLGIDAPVTTDVTIEPIERQFLGSRSRKLLGEYPTDDKLYRFTLGTPVPFTRTDNDKPVASTVVNENFNNVYDYYMGGDIGETIIKTNRPGLPRVLVVGDSFTNPLEGILYTSCDEMRSLDYRHYDGENILDYIADYQPDVVLYEEQLDEAVITGAVNAISSADTLIVGGTSLVVYPAAGLINYFRGKDIVLINKSQTGYDDRATLVINDSIGKVLGD